MSVGLVSSVAETLTIIDSEPPGTALLDLPFAGNTTPVAAAFLAGPTAKELRLGVSDQQLDQAREVAGGPLPSEKRKTLARMRELIAAATSLRKDLVQDLNRVGAGRGRGHARHRAGEARGCEIPPKLTAGHVLGTVGALPAPA
jgi:hypothetical protein